MNREEWLTQLAVEMQEQFASVGLDFPEKGWRVSVGFPGGGSPRKRIGECWPHEASEDGSREVFISPLLDDKTEVAATLCHEMIHACLPSEVGHKAPFAVKAKALGLEGKPTSTVAGEGFTSWASPLLDALPDYPHAKLNLTDRKKQSTRMVKVECAPCEYILRGSRKTLEMGLPHCGVCGEEMQVAE